ncbi:MAG: hypothetical protein RMK17_02700, partial [bacterium]|nr:hypothetical protein [bacterium]
IGWIHRGLVDVAQAYGFLKSKSYDYFSKSFNFAFSKLEKEIKKHPVIISIYKNFNPQNGGGHLCVLSDIKNKNKFIIFDPDARQRKKVIRKIKLSIFKRGWKKRFIVIKF